MFLFVLYFLVFIFMCTAVLHVYCVLQVSIAGLCREAGALFYCGAATQIGSAGGALTAFILVTQVQNVVFLTRKVFITVNFFIASYTKECLSYFCKEMAIYS